jgi:hypothetical protein
MISAYGVPAGSPRSAFARFTLNIGFCQGSFALLHDGNLPRCFPYAGFRHNGALAFRITLGALRLPLEQYSSGLFSKVGDHRAALVYAGLLFLPADSDGSGSAQATGLYESYIQNPSSG